MLKEPIAVISHKFSDPSESRVVVELLDRGAWGMLVNMTLYRDGIELHHCEEEEFVPRQRIFQASVMRSKILHGKRQFRNGDKWDRTYTTLVVQAILDAVSFQETTVEGKPVCALIWDDELEGSVFATAS